MTLSKIVLKSKTELVDHIKTHIPSFYFSSMTSTVIPYDKLESVFSGENDFCLADLSALEPKMEMEGENLRISGAVNWKDAKEFLQMKGRTIMTAPTEELALVSAGLATSATGERCFHFGSLRTQVVSLKYIDFNGEEKELFADNDYQDQSPIIKAFQNEFKLYSSFKNAPFPRLEKEIDLMIGTEGQLGVITEVLLKTCENYAVNHLFMLLPKWEDNIDAHLEVAEKIQNFKETVILCELIDSNSFEHLAPEDRPNQGMDAIFFEIKSDSFESFYENFLLSLSFLEEDKVFELSESKFHHLRASVPRAVQETNSRKGITKLGTDVQVKIKDFKTLLGYYQEFSKLGISYNLFGHFGDAHLHFNFMPTSDQTELCQEQLKELYLKIRALNGSPFAEHGVGVIKQKFIKDFLNGNHIEAFRYLKEKNDPHNQFFPQGYLNIVID